MAAALYHKRQAAFGQPVAVAGRFASGEHGAGAEDATTRDGERKGAGSGLAHGSVVAAVPGGEAAVGFGQQAAEDADHEEEPGLYDADL